MIVWAPTQRRTGDGGVAHAAAAEHGDGVASVTSPVLTAAPKPAMTPQPSRPTASGRASGSTLVHWPAATRVLLGEGADAQRRRQLGAVRQGHLLGGVVRVEDRWGCAPSAGPALPHTARQFRTTKSPGATR